MNKVYILAPLLGLAIFFGYFVHFSKGYEAEKALKAAAIKVEKDKAMQKENEARKIAMDIALQQQEQRKKDKAEREEKDRLDKEARQAAVEAQAKAYRDQEKLAKQVDRLNKEIEGEKAAVTKIEEAKKVSKDDEAFLQQFIKQADANAKSLADLIEKINAADLAREKAAADAAAAFAAAAKAK